MDDHRFVTAMLFCMVFSLVAVLPENHNTPFVGTAPAGNERVSREKEKTMTKRWYIEDTETGTRRGPYSDYDDCVADANRMDNSRIFVQDAESGDQVTAWDCPECGDTVEADTDTLAAVGTPYCSPCDCEMERTDNR